MRPVRQARTVAVDPNRRSGMTRTLLTVRAELADAADRPAFDRWYETEHLPDALKVFQAERAWRCWSAVDPRVHYAFYQFAGVEAAQSVLQSAGRSEEHTSELQPPQ